MSNNIYFILALTAFFVALFQILFIKKKLTTRSILTLLGALLILIFAFQTLWHSQTVSNNLSASQSLSSSSNSTITGDVEHVTRAIDGDTFELSNGQKVRYIGIDTPETVKPNTPVQCYGKEASNKDKQLIEGQDVTLVKDVSETDKYGRLLRYVYLNGVFINEELVKEGYGRADNFPPDIKYEAVFMAAEQQAKQNKIGLWGTCPYFGSPAN